MNLNEVVTFYNKYGLEMRPLLLGEENFFLSNKAPLCIIEETTNEKSMFMWSDQVCPDFQKAFGTISQEVCGKLKKVEMKNTCNFNS